MVSFMNLLRRYIRLSLECLMFRFYGDYKDQSKIETYLAHLDYGYLKKLTLNSFPLEKIIFH